MRNLQINKRKLYVLNYLGQVEVVDKDNYKTGETTNSYSDPKEFRASVSGAKGSSQVEMFGTEIKYDKTILMSVSLFRDLCITENSVLFVDTEPTFDTNHFPLYNYKVVKIAETINEVAIAISKTRAS